MSQTSGYGSDQALGVEGQLAETMKTDMDSLQNVESSGIGFGLGVVDEGDGTFSEIDAVTDELGGVLVHSHAYDNADLDPAGVPTKQMGDVLKRGRVIVFPEVAVSRDDEVFCRFDDGVADPTLLTKGKFRNTSDSYTAMHVNRARFVSDADAGAPAILELLDGFGQPDLVHIHQYLSTPTGDADASAAAAITHENITATQTYELGAVPTNRHVKVKSAHLSCGITAGDDTDHWVIQLRAGTTPTVLAAFDSDVAEDGAVTQNTPTAMNAQAAAGLSGERLWLVLTKNASAAAITPGAFSAVLEVF